MLIPKLLALAFLTTSFPLTAQSTVTLDPIRQAQKPGPEAPAIREAAARFIGAFLDQGKWFAEAYTNRPRLLESGTFPKVVRADTVLVASLKASPLPNYRLIDTPLPLRTVEETRTLAGLMGAGVATSADSIWCKSGSECYGATGTTLITLGNPTIWGDTAVIVFGLLTRSAPTARNPTGLPSRLNSIAVYLSREEKGWVARSLGLANQNRVTSKWKPGDPDPRYNTKPE